MREFTTAALGLPPLVLGLVLLAVLLYWALVAAGLDPVAGAVPAVTVSLFTAVAWFADVAGTVLLDRAERPGAAGKAAVLLAALLLSALVTRRLMRPLGRMLTEEQVPSRLDFVGRLCVVRTGRVDLTFGQAEVRAQDGSSALVQVRQQRNRADEPALKAGSTALIFDYDAEGEFFWVMPYDAELDPHRPPR